MRTRKHNANLQLPATKAKLSISMEPSTAKGLYDMALRTGESQNAVVNAAIIEYIEPSPLHEAAPLMLKELQRLEFGPDGLDSCASCGYGPRYGHRDECTLSAAIKAAMGE